MLCIPFGTNPKVPMPLDDELKKDFEEKGVVLRDVDYLYPVKTCDPNAAADISLFLK